METPNKFEEQWREAFDGAEASPSPAVWDKVELAVANSANGSFKRRILFFKLMAAASVAFAFTVAGIGIYREYYSTEDTLTLASDNQDSTSIPSAQDFAVSSNKNIESIPQMAGNDSSSQDQGNVAIATDITVEKQSAIDDVTPNGGSATENMDVSPDQSVASVGSSGRLSSTEELDTSPGTDLVGEDIARSHLALSEIEEGKTTTIVSDSPQNQNLVTIPHKLEKRMAELEAFTFSDPELSMVPWYGAISQSKKTTESGKFWAGLGMDGGSFNPSGGISGVSSDEATALNFNEDGGFSSSAQSPTVGREENGRSINIGLNFGARIARRWIIQSGVVLMDRSTTNSSNIVQDTGNSLRAINAFSELSSTSDLNVIDTYEIDNSYRFISVPVQAGYLLLDRKFAITLLGGVSNDLFLSKSVDGQANGFQEYNVEDGIRRYNLTGLMGTELGYKFGQHYLFAITPQIRQAISTTTISGEDVRPTFFELGFRFKYLLK